MSAEWITSSAARRILLHWADRRPAWLWSGDGGTLLWRNSAARLFNGKLKKTGLRLSAGPVPIKGQVARLVRLGSIGRSSLSRVQFLAGERPVATTCTCTPLVMMDGEVAVLLVGVDPVAQDIIDTAGGLTADAMSAALFPSGWSWRLDNGPAPEVAGEIQVQAGPGNETLVLSPPSADVPSAIAAVRAEEGVGTEIGTGEDAADEAEPPLPLALEAVPSRPAVPTVVDPDDWVTPDPEPGEPRALSSLFDRLAGDADLYAPLTPADEEFRGVRAHEPDTPVPPAPPESDLIARVIAHADDPEAHPDPAEPTVPNANPSHWLITGRGFRALQPPPGDTPPGDAPAADADAPAGPEPEAAASEAPPEAPAAGLAAADMPPTLADIADAEAAERVSRYNFEELGRILTDRVASDPKAEVVPAWPAEPPAAAPAPSTPAASGIINLNAETLVLNRLPLAILVFRDQQVLFANRALTDLLGHESVAGLRAAGIASIFPAEDAGSAGPVNRLIRRDGTPINVTARLQSVSWQGRGALMLSAGAAEPVRSHEAAVRAFVEIAATARGEGYITADRAGIVSFVSAPGRALLGRGEAELAGRPLAALVGQADMEPLRQFLEKPARFAETARPYLTGVSDNGAAEITLFAEGQAGIVSGYFGFVRARAAATAPVPGKDDDLEPGMLGRLSRGIRQPLNTIIGFADLLRATADGEKAGERVAEYARDIRTAGLEIAVLADELDDFTRLRDGRYAPRTADIDLATLLESCMVRVRGHASAARVLVRSAIPDRLPRIRADRSSLGQALLNLLASAIDHTPVGGSVILSAQSEEDGAIAIHVRDGAQDDGDPGERFVVFRDGIDKDGEQLRPARSSVGLALTRSLLAVNACSLSVDPTTTTGTLFSLSIPADAIVRD